MQRKMAYSNIRSGVLGAEYIITGAVKPDATRIGYGVSKLLNYLLFNPQSCLEILPYWVFIYRKGWFAWLLEHMGDMKTRYYTTLLKLCVTDVLK